MSFLVLATFAAFCYRFASIKPTTEKPGELLLPNSEENALAPLANKDPLANN
jgi:hypothetical protein